MGNTICPSEDVTRLASVARGVCPFPDYTPSPLFANMLSVNPSSYLSEHYTAVQSSLNPKQLEDFTQSLRTTFGREGRVSYGGVGVVALSLTVLFHTLAKQAKGEYVPDSGPIPGLFYKDLRGHYPPLVHTVSEYLRLVPHIANNPTRMREETERCLKQMKTDLQTQSTTDKEKLSLREDITFMNSLLAQLFGDELKKHYLRINGTDSDQLFKVGRGDLDNLIFNLNCDPETADQEFLSEVQRSDPKIRETFREMSSNMSKTTVPNLLMVVHADFVNSFFSMSCRENTDKVLSQREDFDLKVNALSKWGVVK